MMGLAFGALLCESAWVKHPDMFSQKMLSHERPTEVISVTPAGKVFYVPEQQKLST